MTDKKPHVKPERWPKERQWTPREAMNNSKIQVLYILALTGVLMATVPAWVRPMELHGLFMGGINARIAFFLMAAEALATILFCVKPSERSRKRLTIVSVLIEGCAVLVSAVFYFIEPDALLGQALVLALTGAIQMIAKRIDLNELQQED